MGINEIYVYAQNKNARIEFENLIKINYLYIYIEDLNLLIINSKFKNLII